MSKLFLVALLVATFGCDRGSYTETESEPASQSQLELRGLPAEAVLVGVTIAPDGKRYVLDQGSGLYEVDAAGAQLVFNMSGLNGVVPTDVVALDSERFAITAENDGFLFERRSSEFSSYFCYLPSTPPQEPENTPAEPEEPATPVTLPVSVSQRLQAEGVAVKQRTESVAFNTETRQLFAQPRTTRLDTGAVAGSELFVFDEVGGEPVRVLPFDDASFVAGGMVTAPGDRLLLGAGNRLYEVTLDGGPNLLRVLLGSIDITGMARDPNGDIWLLDGPARRLTKLDENP